MARSFRGYTILRPLGMGGMASIYLGVQENLKRQVAIKLLDKRLALNDDFVRRFEREARAASELNHRNIITIHEFGNENDDYFIIMEYCEGGDLRDALGKVPVFPPEVALIILEEMAAGLAAAHAKDIVHRDIKPANVLLSQDGDLKVTDFGLARDFSVDASRLFDSLTVQGTVLGTPSYMSPEQASSLPVNDRTDVWSLGVMAWEMFTGERPFVGGTYSEVRDAILESEPPPLDLERPMAVPQIEQMLRLMLSKEAGQRPSMKQLLHHIESCMEALDPSGMLLRYRRRFLEKFAADPVAFSAKLERNAVRASLDRGIYAKALGLERLEQAKEHLEFVQKHDPENPRAKSALRDIQNVAEPAEASAEAPGAPTNEGPPSALEVTQVTPIDNPPAPSASESAGDESAARASRSAGPATQVVTERKSAGVAMLAVALGLLAVGSFAWTQGWIPGLGAAGSAPEFGIGSGVDSSAVGNQSPPAAAWAFVRTQPAGARVDWRREGADAFLAAEDVTPLRLSNLTPGNYEFRLRLEGHEPQTRTLVVGDGGIDSLSVVMPKVELAKVDPPKQPTLKPKPKPKSDGHKSLGGTEVAVTDVPKKKIRTPAPARDGWIRLSTEPAGNFFVNGALVAPNATNLTYAVPGGQDATVEVRHPELWGSKTFRPKVAAGDTLELGSYVVKTGKVRVSTRPRTPVGVLIDGRATRKETPMALDVASRSQLVGMQSPGWDVEKVVITDRTDAANSREVVPSDPASFRGVLLDVLEGHDVKVVFHLAPKDDGAAAN